MDFLNIGRKREKRRDSDETGKKKIYESSHSGGMVVLALEAYAEVQFFSTVFQL